MKVLTCWMLRKESAFGGHVAVENLFMYDHKCHGGNTSKVWERTVRPVPIFRDLGFAQIDIEMLLFS